MGQLNIYVLEDEDGYLARAPALPGVYAVRPTRAAAIERALELLREELALLREHGLPAPDIGPNDVTIAEYPARLSEDFVPLTADEIPLLLRRLELSRERLLALLADRSPPDLARADADGWSINQTLEHIANAEWWYMDRLFVWPADPRAAAADQRRRLVERLAGMDAAEQARRTVHSGEEWTPRTVLRRALEVERAWGAYIRAALAGEPAQAPPFAWEGNETRPNEGPAFSDAENDGVEELIRLGDTLMELVVGLSSEELERAPAGSDCSIAEALRRLAGAYWFLRSRLTDWPRDALARMAAIRAAAVERLAHLSEAERTRVTQALWGEQWTARKVFRRFLEHEREHYDQIRVMLER